MHKNRRLPIGQIIFRGRLLFLLIYLLALIAALPIDEALGRFGLILNIAVSIILVSAVYAISEKSIHTVIGILLAVPLLFLVWAKQIFEIPWLQIPETVIGITFFVFIITIVLKFIFSQEEITGDMLAGAASVYLMLAIIWMYAYRLIALIQPGSFAIADAQNIEQTTALYFSFVTITTLGYGDIFPVTTLAKSCAILEAVVGQLYLVVTVAWLVGMQVSHRMARKSKNIKSDKQEE